MSETSPRQAPLTPSDCDLRGYEFMPVFGHQLFGSELYLKASAEEFRAAMRLWWAAWNQCPAASLPSNDGALAQLADFGRDVKSWRRVREVALHGFVECEDGRLYHPFLAAKAVDAFDRRLRSDTKRTKDRDRLRNWRDQRRIGQTQRISSPPETLVETDGETRFETSSVGRERERESLTSLRDADPLIKVTAKGAAFTEALAGVQQLRVPGRDLRAFVGRLIKEAGGDVTIVADVVQKTLADPPADPDVRGWLIGCCREGARRTRRGPTPNDAPDAWASYADRVGPDTDQPDGPVHAWCAGWAIDVIAGKICDAAGLAWTFDDWQQLESWLRDDLGDDRILPAIRRMAARPGYQPPGSLRFFDKAVRANLRAA